jgi:hypothetical protein
VFLIFTKLELSAVQNTDPPSVKGNLLNYGVVGTFVSVYRASNSCNPARIFRAAHRLPKHLRRGGIVERRKLSRAVLDWSQSGLWAVRGASSRHQGINGRLPVEWRNLL